MSKLHQPGLFKRYFSSPEFCFLFVIFAAICATFVVVLSLDWFRDGATAGFDEALILAFRDADNLSDPVGPHWVEEMARDFTALGGFPVLTLLTFAIVGFLFFRGHRATAMLILITTLLALALSSSLKQTIDRSRPDLVPHGQHVYTKSFPSGHSMHAAATYFTLASLLALFQRRRRLKFFCLSIAAVTTVLVGFSRVYLGVHWPTDVLGGWGFGTLCALLTLLLARWLLSLPEVAEEVDGEVNHDEGVVDEPV